MYLNCFSFLVILFVVLEVMKVLKAKKHAKTRKTEEDTVQLEKQGSDFETKKREESDQGKTYQVHISHILISMFLFFFNFHDILYYSRMFIFLINLNSESTKEFDLSTNSYITWHMVYQYDMQLQLL